MAEDDPCATTTDRGLEHGVGSSQQPRRKTSPSRGCVGGLPDRLHVVDQVVQRMVLQHHPFDLPAECPQSRWPRTKAFTSASMVRQFFSTKACCASSTSGIGATTKTAFMPFRRARVGHDLDRLLALRAAHQVEHSRSHRSRPLDRGDRARARARPDEGGVPRGQPFFTMECSPWNVPRSRAVTPIFSCLQDLLALVALALPGGAPSTWPRRTPSRTAR